MHAQKKSRIIYTKMLTRVISVFWDYRWFLFPSLCSLMFWQQNGIKRTYLFFLKKNYWIEWKRTYLMQIWHLKVHFELDFSLDGIFRPKLDDRHLRASVCHMESCSALDSFQSHALILSSTDGGAHPLPMPAGRRAGRIWKRKGVLFQLGCSIMVLWSFYWRYFPFILKFLSFFFSH